MNEGLLERPRGLPAPLPEGERVLWQGAPDWRSLARHAFHAPKVALYFALLAAVRVIDLLYTGAGIEAVLVAMAWFVPITLVAVLLLVALAWMHARTTSYTITNRRVVIRYGVALPMSVNLPFRTIASAALRTFKAGDGEIPLTLNGDGRIAYLHLWPHARRWRFTNPEPMLRGVPQAAEVAGILARALQAANHSAGPAIAARSSVATDAPAAQSLAVAA